MTDTVTTTDSRPKWMTTAGWRALFRERPIIPLIGLLAILVVVSELIRPGIVNLNWAGVMVRAAVPLAILAGCQTMTMLTGGIDLSVGAVASMSGFVVATLVGGPGLATGILVALAVAAIVGLISGIGVGVFRVHPLIMTLGMSLVVLGFANVWQIQMVQTGSGVPDQFRELGAGMFLGSVPRSLLLFVPLAILIILGLNRTGYGRLLYAIGDNPIASRLSGARSWQVLIVLYMLSAVLAGVAGFLYSGLTNVAYSATQYALFSSVMLLLPKFVAGFSGAFVDAFGYAAFFHSTALLGVPVLLLVWLASRVHAQPRADVSQPSPSQ